MDSLRVWVRSIVCYLCFIQIVDQVLPDGSYRKYVRFFCGLLLIVLVISPFTDAVGLSEKLAREWRTTTLQEEWDSMNMEQESLKQLQEQTITEACKKEMERQATAVAEGNGMENAEAEVTFAKDSDVLEMEKVRITGKYPDTSDKKTIQEHILQELGHIYQIDQEKVVFMM